MSRLARRAAAQRRKYLLLGITAAVVLLILIFLAIQLIGGNETSPSDGSLSGNTDTNTVIITSTDPSQNTDSNTDVNSVTENQTDSNSVTESQTDSNTDTSTDSNTDTSSTTDSNTDASDTDPDEDKPLDFTSFELALINPDHPVPDNFPLQLSWVSLNGKDRQVHSVCADAFKKMVNAAKKDGVTLLLRSTYRDFDYQTMLFNNKVKEYTNKGYSQEDATRIAATIVAVPGTSEHQTGLAADITTPSFDRLNENFDKTEAFQWLITHCAEYGFILRYPKDKTEITKIIYEPWHYRYVGTKAAKIIMSEGICYEEFVEKYGNQ